MVEIMYSSYLMTYAIKLLCDLGMSAVRKVKNRKFMNIKSHFYLSYIYATNRKAKVHKEIKYVKYHRLAVLFFFFKTSHTGCKNLPRMK